MKRFKFKSIYTQIVVTYAGIWWFVTIITLNLIGRSIGNSSLIVHNEVLNEEISQFRIIAIIIILISTTIGTLAILYFSRNIVKPIVALSKASQEVEKGNFSINVDYDGKDELAVLSENFNRMVKSVKETDELRKEFVTNVSHEFKTPVTSIKGFAQLIKEDHKDKQTQEYCQIIIDESMKLSHLASDLLLLSQLDTELSMNTEVNIRLDECIRRVIISRTPLLDEKNIEIKLNIEEVIYPIKEIYAEQIFDNLISNAIKYSNENSMITISLFSTDDTIKFMVTDQGIGIDKEKINRIFDRFYKANDHRSIEGHGIGLAIVKTIVDKYYGSIDVSSKLGVGSTFTISLPKNI